MKYLVTGGAGFIGSHIAEALVARGETVRVFDNLSTGKLENISDFKSSVELVEGDLREKSDVQRAVAGVDIVFHEAAVRSVPRSVDDPSSSNDANITGTLNLLMACREAKVRRVVYASSSSVYGDKKVFPQKETFATSPLSPYAVSKLAAENYMVVFAKTFGLETVSLRYFNVFGPWQYPESQYAAVLPKFIQSAQNGTPLDIHWDGKQSRDFTYIANVVEANLLAAHKPSIGGEVFNIACGETTSLLQIARGIEKIVGHSLERKHYPKRAGDVRKTFADIGKAKKLLGYKPSVGFSDGLRKTWDWHMKQASLTLAHQS